MRPRDNPNMEKSKRQRLERAGWIVGDAGDFIELSAAAEPKHTGSPFALPEVSGAMLQLEGNVLGS
jgi:hypothetical protein